MREVSPIGSNRTVSSKSVSGIVSEDIFLPHHFKFQHFCISALGTSSSSDKESSLLRSVNVVPWISQRQREPPKDNSQGISQRQFLQNQKNNIPSRALSPRHNIRGWPSNFLAPALHMIYLISTIFVYSTAKTKT